MNAPSEYPVRRTMNLVKGRLSLCEARYFITLSAKRPSDSLTHSAVAVTIANRLRTMKDEGDAQILCATIMPDHVHLLIRLGTRLPLNRLIAKFKAQTRQVLFQEGVFWQRNFYEHRLRPNDSANDFARYIFLNPYRAGLIERRAKWPFWMQGEGVDFNFLQILEDGQYPPDEWCTADLLSLGLNQESVGSD